MNVAGTPVTNNSSLPNDQNLVARLTATLSPVKTTNEAKAYLEQRSLIAIDNNYGTITLVNLLIYHITSQNPQSHSQCHEGSSILDDERISEHIC